MGGSTCNGISPTPTPTHFCGTSRQHVQFVTRVARGGPRWSLSILRCFCSFSSTAHPPTHTLPHAYASRARFDMRCTLWSSGTKVHLLHRSAPTTFRFQDPHLLRRVLTPKTDRQQASSSLLIFKDYDSRLFKLEQRAKTLFHGHCCRRTKH